MINFKAYIDKNTRIKEKLYPPAFGYAYCLQRKKWYGWKTTAWIYGEMMVNEKRSLYDILLLIER